MTIHIAKGLEWPVVFITGMEDGLFPSLRERDGQSEDAAARGGAAARVRRDHARARAARAHARADPPGLGRDPDPGPVAVPRRSPARRARGTRAALARGPAARDGPTRARDRRRYVAGEAAPPKRFGSGSVSDEFDQRTHDDEPVFRVDEDLEGERAAQPFRSGDTVAHTLLGVGRVVAVSGNGKDMRVIVDFPEAGRKTVLPGFLRTSDDQLN